ncbi:hypothetical protein VSS92_27620, partial [Pseudomonas syringae pv. tagetis]
MGGLLGGVLCVCVDGVVLVVGGVVGGLVVVLVLFSFGICLVLFVGVQPVVLGEHDAWTTFVEQFEVQRRPEVGAQ